MELVKMYTKSGHILVLDVFALVKNAMLVMTFPCLRLLTGKRLECFSKKKNSDSLLYVKRKETQVRLTAIFHVTFTYGGYDV